MKRAVNVKKKYPGCLEGCGDFIYIGQDWSCSKHGLFDLKENRGRSKF